MVKTVSTYIKFCAKPRVRQFHIFDLVSIDSMVYSLKGFFFFFFAWRGALATTYLYSDAQFSNFLDCETINISLIIKWLIFL